MENHTSEAVKGGQEAEVSLPSSTPPRDFMGEIVEGDDEFGLQWLSMFVEDCHSATFHHHHPPLPTTLKPPPPPPPQEPPNSVNNPTAPLEAKNRKRKLNPLAHHQSSFNYILTPPSDPPLLQQTHWLAESELIFPLKREDEEQKSPPSPLLLKPEEEEEEELDEDEEVIFHPKRENDDEREEEQQQQQQQQQQRRCSHCLSLKTPQWRAGPLGPKTLCNACGVRFKSGRLLPEYRPAKSPTFLEDKHSNSHKKIMEMRQLSTKK